MPWIEITEEKHINGALRKPDYRCNFPYLAAKALACSGAAIWVDGPHKEKPDEPQPRECSDASGEDVTPADDPVQEEEPPPSIEISADDLAEETAPLTEPTPEEFAGLSAHEQRDIIREIGLQEECDLRSTTSMQIAYAAYCGEE